MTNIIDGKKISNEITENLKNKVSELKDKGIVITMADILVGEDKASAIYLETKKKKFENIGINFMPIILNEKINEKELITKIDELNDDKKINAIFIEMPLPKHIDSNKIINKINPSKDVDGFNAINLGNLFKGNDAFYPCTAEGIVALLDYSNINVEGKHVVIIGRSIVVGKPLSILLLNKNATVTICHSKTNNLKDICKTADILIVAIGKANFIDDTYVKEGSIVIDAGINRVVLDGVNKVCGDVDFDKVFNMTSYITPVPGGVGPMTVTMLIKHCLKTVENGKI